MPKRLNDVGEDESSTLIKLCTCIQIPLAYAALSYCWGPRTKGILETTKSTLSAFETAIPENTLPQTLKDAIFTTRQLNIRYLWVDALCTVQDSTQDKLEEIAKMEDIYQNAQVTIAAARAESCKEGIPS